MQEFPGTIGDAQERWRLGVLVELGIAFSEQRPPGLVVDSSICGLNSRCHVPEKSILASSTDVQRCFPLRQNPYPLSCLSLDVKSAHKRIIVRSSERGLLGSTFDNKLYFCKVCPFGAVFSASWWGRLSGFLMRFFPLTNFHFSFRTDLRRRFVFHSGQHFCCHPQHLSFHFCVRPSTFHWAGKVRVINRR